MGGGSNGKARYIGVYDPSSSHSFVLGIVLLLTVLRLTKEVFQNRQDVLYLPLSGQGETR